MIATTTMGGQRNKGVASFSLFDLREVANLLKNQLIINESILLIKTEVVNLLKLKTRHNGEI